MQKSNHKPPDGGWGWVIVLSSLVISLIQDGISFSFGLLFTELLAQFEASKSKTAWIGSLLISVPLLVGPWASVLVDRYGCRAMTITGGLIAASGFLLSYFANGIVALYFTFGIVSGMGLGLTFITEVVCVTFWFEKKRNLAVGLSACGTGIGTFVYSPLTSFLLQEYGWRWSVVLLGGTLLNLCVCGALLRDPPWLIKAKHIKKIDRNENWQQALVNLFGDFHYILMSISTVLLFAWFMTPYFYLVDHMKSLGYPQSAASFVLSALGIANTFGMIFFGWAGDQPWINVPKTYGVSLILCGAALFGLYHWTFNYTMLNICAILFGLFLASCFSFTPIMLVKILTLDQFTRAYGLQLMCQGLGHLSGPPIAAFLADITETWAYSFYLSALSIASSGVLILGIAYTENKRIWGCHRDFP